MINSKHFTRQSAWLTALLALTLLAGCGGGKWDSSTQPGTETPAVATVTALNPESEATGVAIATPVTATFSTPMKAASINDSTFTLAGPGDTAVAGSVSYSMASMTATFMPTDSLAPSTTYTAVITTDAQTEAGDALASERRWSFTTAVSDAAPAVLEVTDVNPINSGTGVCTDRSVRATFSEQLDPSSITSPAVTFTLSETSNALVVDGDVSLDANGTTAIFTPTAPLQPETDYTATITTDVKDLSGDSLENETTWTFNTNGSVCQQATIALGNTISYGVLSNTGVTLGGGPDSTTGLRVDGDVGIFPAGACSGCDTTTVSGLIEIGTTAAEDAMTALEAAYNDATNRATNLCTLIDSGVLTTNPSATCGGGADGVFGPGLYWSGTSIAIPAGGTITLDGGNDANAVFIFQSESTINTIGGDTHMLLVNGAQAKNVFWVAQSSATIGGDNSDFSGTVLALIGITVNTGTNMVGRALAKGAEVIVQDQALITVPTE